MSGRFGDSKEHGRDLDKSNKVIGQLYPVLRDARGRVIDGFHRIDVDPNWKSIDRRKIMDLVYVSSK